MRIILNPEEGAPIQDIQINGKRYFKEPWEINTLKKFEDDKVANAILGLYEFLIEFTLDEAKSYVDEQKRRTYKCIKCNLATTTQLALDKHLEKHTKEENLTKELGVEEVTGEGEEFTQKDFQEIVDEQAKREGLTGGLVDETRPVVARF